MEKKLTSIMTYREWLDWQYSLMKPWKRWMYRANPPSWYHFYLQYALRKILNSASTYEEAEEVARVALGIEEG